MATTPRWIEALDGFRAGTAQASPRSCTGIGLLLMDLGIAVCAAGAAMSLALMNIGFGMALAGALLARAPLLRMPGVIAGCATALGVAVSVATTVWLHRHAHPAGGLALVYGWLAIPVATIAFDRARARRWALAASTVTLAATAVLALTQFVYGCDPNHPPLHLSANGLRHDRSVGFFGGPLTLAGTSALLLLAHLGAGAGTRRRIAIIGAASAALLSMSRMAWMALVVGGGARVLVTARSARVIVRAVLVAVAAAAVFAVLHPDRLRNGLRGDDGRVVIWSISTELIAESPWVGSGGAHGFRARYTPRWHERYGDGAALAVREPVVAHAHNSLLSVAVFYGLPVAVAHLAWLLALLRAAVLGRARSRRGFALLLSAWLAYAVAGCCNDTANQMEYVYALAIAVGLGMSAIARRESDEAR